MLGIEPKSTVCSTSTEVLSLQPLRHNLCTGDLHTLATCSQAQVRPTRVLINHLPTVQVLLCLALSPGCCTLSGSFSLICVVKKKKKKLKQTRG